MPVVLLKTGAPKLIEKTAPEANLYLAVAGIAVALAVECFIIICATQFLLDKER